MPIFAPTYYELGNNNVLHINPQNSGDEYYYLNSNFEQSYDNLLINLNQLNGYSGGGTFLDVSKVGASDFTYDGLIYNGIITETNGPTSTSYVSFLLDDFGHDWQGYIEFNANLDFLGSGSYNFPTNYFKADTDHPEILSIVRLDYDSIPNEYSVPADSLGSYYFLVSFSEMVNGTLASNNYFASAGYSINQVVYTSDNPSGMNPTDEVLVKVTSVGNQASGSSVPTLGLNSRLEAMDIEEMSSRPLAADVDIYTSTSYYPPAVGTPNPPAVDTPNPPAVGTPNPPAVGTPNPPAVGTQENWYRMDLSHDVSKYAFLMQSGTGTDTNFKFSTGAFSISDPNMTYPQVQEIAFQKNAYQVDEFFFRTSTPINTDTIEVYFSAATSWIKDLAGNYLPTNNIVTIDDETIASDGTVATRITPPASGGFDTLKITLAGDVFVDANDEILEHHFIQVVNEADVQGFDVYEFDGSNFSRYEINATTVSFDGFAGDSEVVALYRIGNNDINLVSSATDVETDIVDYSAVSDGIRVDLSEANSTNNWYVDVSVIGGTIDDEVDTLRGAEGVIGGSGNDDITGNGIDNILVGGGGADRLDGDDGDDILVGGASPLGIDDVLLGGKGQDMLIDLDGASMTGGQDDRPSNSPAAPKDIKDIYVVRTGSTIEDYATAERNAGLAGRAVGNINDIIVFNVSLAELAFQINNDVTGLSSAEMNEIAANIKIHVSNSDSDAYWEVTATSYIFSEGERINLSLGDVEVMAPVNQGQSLTIVPLDVANYHPSTGDIDIFSQNIDNFVLDNTLPDLSASLNEEGSFNLAFALEETRDGVVRSNGQTLMVGDFGKAERIFNPGNASEMIFGSRGKDTYEFWVQDFRITNIDSAVAQDVGDDIIRDTGGLDNVFFSGLDLDSIQQLTFEAVKVGREKGNYSLKTNYSQTEYGIVNEGSFTWTGHFREGFDMQLEKITLGDDELSLAQNIYNYDDVGRLLSNTPIQQALEGEDTIMVGKSGRNGDDNIFKLEKNGTAPIEQTNLFIWGIDSVNDVIDLSEFITAPDSTLVQAIVDSNDIPLQGKFEVDLNNDDTTFELAIHFMGAFSVNSSTTLEQMIAIANTNNV